MAMSTGETPYEKQFREKYEKILAVDGERAERYAVAIMCAAAERNLPPPSPAKSGTD